MALRDVASLRAQKRNKLRDFVDVAGSLRVSFFLIVSATDKASYLRLVRTPHGPTLTFRIQKYSLCSDVAASLRKPEYGLDAFYVDCRQAFPEMDLCMARLDDAALDRLAAVTLVLHSLEGAPSRQRRLLLQVL